VQEKTGKPPKDDANGSKTPTKPIENLNENGSSQCLVYCRCCCSSCVYVRLKKFFFVRGANSKVEMHNGEGVIHFKNEVDHCEARETEKKNREEKNASSALQYDLIGKRRKGKEQTTKCVYVCVCMRVKKKGVTDVLIEHPYYSSLSNHFRHGCHHHENP